MLKLFHALRDQEIVLVMKIFCREWVLKFSSLSPSSLPPLRILPTYITSLLISYFSLSFLPLVLKQYIWQWVTWKKYQPRNSLWRWNLAHTCQFLIDLSPHPSFDEKHKKLYPSLFTPVLIKFVFATVSGPCIMWSGSLFHLSTTWLPNQCLLNSLLQLNLSNLNPLDWVQSLFILKPWLCHPCWAP